MFNWLTALDYVKDQISKIHLTCVHKYGRVQRVLEDGTSIRRCIKCGNEKYERLHK